MSEININIEGYNVNGICVGCLNYNRKMFYRDEVKNCYKILGNIDVPDDLSIQVCWECLAQIQSVMRFKKQIINSFKVLMAYSKKQTFLGSPNDLSRYAVQRLGVKTFEALYESAQKEEISDEQNGVQFETEITEPTEELFAVENNPHDMPEQDFRDVEDKEDILIIVSSDAEDIQFTYENYSQEQDNSSEDDVVLSQLKTEDIKKRKGDRNTSENKKLKQKSEKIKEKSIKLKNFPEDLVDLYTMDKEEMWSVRQSDASNEEFQKFKYKCDYCLIGFNTKRLMDAHLNGRHTPRSENDYQCNICKAFFTEEKIKMHKKLHLTAYRCRECNFLTSTKRLMWSHDCGENYGDSGHPCPDCPDRIFTTKFMLACHRSVVHRPKPRCDCCGKVFANKMTLKHHLKILPQNKPKETVIMPCKDCGKVFTSEKSYRNHVAIHGGLSYSCPICGKLFQWKHNLVRHTRIHREMEQGATHQCRECGKSFSSRESYNYHMMHTKKHAQKNPYTHVCRFCGKNFATRWCMNDHIDWEHLEIIKYQCTVCDKPFKTARILVAHVKNIHEGKKKNSEPEGEHLCEICGKSYLTVKSLKAHVWNIHTNRSEPKIFECPLCPATFSWQTSIYKHMKMTHYPKRSKAAQGSTKKPEL